MNKLELESIFKFFFDSSVDNETLFMRNSFLSTLFTGFIILITLLHFTNQIRHILELSIRFCLPPKVHPTINDVLPSGASDLDYPFVVVQLPVTNETECYDPLIKCACNLIWPRTKLFIQVLDDSTDHQATQLLNQCVFKWYQLGIPIKAYRRPDRIGFKAGSLKNGLLLMPQAEYAAIFDADFLPEPNFLLRTMPTLIQDPNVAFVQGRWTFTNGKESFLTRMQEIWFNFHHMCQQEGSSRASLYFVFNGTGGVWRVSAIEQCGGWHVDTLVEDMDLSFRAHLNGWRSVYMTDVECLNEIPPTFSAYLSQQYRWISGSTQLIRKSFRNIIRSKSISWVQKIWCLWFLIRILNVTFHFLSFISLLSFGIVFRASYTIYLVNILPAIFQTVTVFIFTPKEIHFIFPYMLFMDAMTFHRSCAAVAGILNVRSTKQWIVTPKFNRVKDTFNENSINIPIYDSMSLMPNMRTSILTRFLNSFQTIIRTIRRCRPIHVYKGFFFLSLYLYFIGWIGFTNKQYVLSFYCLANGFMFSMFAFGTMGR